MVVLICAMVINVAMAAIKTSYSGIEIIFITVVIAVSLDVGRHLETHMSIHSEIRNCDHIVCIVSTLKQPGYSADSSHQCAF